MDLSDRASHRLPVGITKEIENGALVYIVRIRQSQKIIDLRRWLTFVDSFCCGWRGRRGNGSLLQYAQSLHRIENSHGAVERSLTSHDVGANPGLGVTCELSLLLVLILSSDTPIFLSPTNSKIILPLQDSTGHYLVITYKQNNHKPLHQRSLLALGSLQVRCRPKRKHLITFLFLHLNVKSYIIFATQEIKPWKTICLWVAI